MYDIAHYWGALEMATIRERKTSKGESRYLVSVRLKGHPPETATFSPKTHTKRTMSTNLDPKALCYVKNTWTEQVLNTRASAATLKGQNLNTENDLQIIGAYWGYINHSRVSEMTNLSKLSERGVKFLTYCQAIDIVDSSAIILKPSNTKKSSIYTHSV